MAFCKPLSPHVATKLRPTEAQTSLVAVAVDEGRRHHGITPQEAASLVELAELPAPDLPPVICGAIPPPYPAALVGGSHLRSMKSCEILRSAISQFTINLL